MTAAVVLPALAAAAASCGRAVLVGRRRGRVVHVADPGPRGLTPTGRLHGGRSARPLCGQAAPAWSATPFDSRPLCARCQRTLSVELGTDPHRLARLLPPGTLERALQTAPDNATLHAVTLAVLALPGPQSARLNPLVRDARQRLAAAAAAGSGLTDGDVLGFNARQRPASRFPMRAAR